MSVSKRPGPRQWLRGLVLLTVYLALAVGAALLMGIDVGRYLARVRGLEDGLAADMPSLVEPRFGMNVSLEQYPDPASLRQALSLVRSAGFGTIRQRFAWSELEPTQGHYRWAQWDQVLPIVRESGLQVIAVLDTSPSWARPTWEADNPWAPPSLPEDYARFVRAFVTRYGHLVMAYQIWDQPNISPHWGQGAIDPAAYVELLRLSSQAIRGADPDAQIIAGGLAPNLEPGGRNMSDLLFLREIYRRGAGAYFDVLGAKPYGFWSGPDDRRVDPQVLNFSRVILLRQEMVRRGEAHKPIWALESGWCGLPADWQGNPSPQGSDDPRIQEDRLHAAMLRVQQEWPWMGLMCSLHLQPDAAPDDPIWGYSLLEPDGQPRPLLAQLRLRLAGEPVAHPGFSRDPSAYEKPASAADRTELLFWGTDLVLEIERGKASGHLAVQVDDQARPTIIDLDADRPYTASVRVGRRMPAGTHRVSLLGTTEQIGTLAGLRVGHRRRPGTLWATIVVGGIALCWFVLSGVEAACQVPWRRAWRWARERWLLLPQWAQWLVAATAMLALALVPTVPLRLACLGLYAACALMRPDLALLAAVACIPLAPLHLDLGMGSFSLTEISLLVALAAHLWAALLARPASKAGLWARLAFVTRLDELDWAVLLLVLLGLGTSCVAEYRRVAFRELRVVVCESALLYLLVRTLPGHRRQLLRLTDTLWCSALLVAVYALVRYPFAEGVIEAEGVRRARAFFGSPNNLALYLERVLPLGLAVVIWGRSPWRRWLYGLGCIPVVLAILLTFSRGALLLGVPAVLLALTWLGKRRVRWIPLAVAGAVVLVAMASGGGERLFSILDSSRGTTYLRLSLWQAAWDMARDHPWLGVGLDNFLYYYGDYIRAGAEVDRWLSHPHNLLLDFWLRLGAGGVVALVALLVGFARRTLRALRSLPEGDLQAMVLGLGGGMAAFVVHGSVDSSYFVIELAFWFTFALAWVSRASQVAGPGALANGPPACPSTEVVVE